MLLEGVTRGVQCFSRGYVPVFLGEHIATCYFLGGGLDPMPPPPPLDRPMTQVSLAGAFCNNAIVWYILDYVDFMTITPSVLSGLPDPVFGVLTTNPNFTSIVKTALAHAPSGLASRLGYRGFTITLYRGGKYFRSHVIELHVNVPHPQTNILKPVLNIHQHNHKQLQ